MLKTNIKMNIAKEIYKQLITHAGDERFIKGLSATQKKAFREGYANPNLSTVKRIFVENGLPATIEIKSQTTTASIIIL